MPRSSNIFISCPTGAMVLARQLKESFYRQGLRACIAEHDIGPGEGLAAKIVAEIIDAPLFLALIDQAFLDSRWCQWELAMAFHGRKKIRWIDLDGALRPSQVDLGGLTVHVVPWFADYRPDWRDELAAAWAITAAFSAFSDNKSMGPPKRDVDSDEIARKLACEYASNELCAGPSRVASPPADILVFHGVVAVVIDARPDAAAQLCREIYGVSVPPPWWHHTVELGAGLAELQALEKIFTDCPEYLKVPRIQVLLFVHRMLPPRPGATPEDWTRPATWARPASGDEILRLEFCTVLARLIALQDPAGNALVDFCPLTSHPPSGPEFLEVPSLARFSWQHTFASPGYARLLVLWRTDRIGSLLLRSPRSKTLPPLADGATRLVLIGTNPDGLDLQSLRERHGPRPHPYNLEAWDYECAQLRTQSPNELRRMLATDVGVSPLVALLARLGEHTLVLTSAIGGAFERLMPPIAAVFRVDGRTAEGVDTPLNSDTWSARRAALLSNILTTITAHKTSRLEILVLGTPWADPHMDDVVTLLLECLRTAQQQEVSLSFLTDSGTDPRRGWRPDWLPGTVLAVDPFNALHDMIVEALLRVGSE